MLIESKLWFLETDPESITRINATYISDREMTLEWSIPSGDYDAFEVQYINADERLVDNLTLHPSITISGLRPFRNYTFTVIVQCGSDADVLRKSNPVSAVFSTKESKPGQVRYFAPIEVWPSNITFEWALPEADHNGILTSFIISYGVKVSKPVIIYSVCVGSHYFKLYSFSHYH